MDKFNLIILLGFILSLFAVSSTALADEITVPVLNRRVNDLTGTLNSEETRSLEETLAQFEKQTSNQIVVLMIPSTLGESFEDYSLRVAEKNKLGKKGRDNGVLLIIAKDDKKIRIEVGYGLEGSLTDATSDQIIRNVIIPKFRQSDFYGGISDGVEAICLTIKGEYQGDENNRGIKNYVPLLFILFILVFGFLPRIFGSGRRHYVGSSGYYSRGPWLGGGMGGFGGGGFSGGSFGGFSGGGGSFGGGGASGSW
jgi:uncharacterized protein